MIPKIPLIASDSHWLTAVSPGIIYFSAFEFTTRGGTTIASYNRCGHVMYYAMIISYAAMRLTLCMKHSITIWKWSSWNRKHYCAPFQGSMRNHGFSYIMYPVNTFSSLPSRALAFFSFLSLSAAGIMMFVPTTPNDTPTIYKKQRQGSSGLWKSFCWNTAEYHSQYQ